VNADKKNEFLVNENDIIPFKKNNYFSGNTDNYVKNYGWVL